MTRNPATGSDRELYRSEGHMPYEARLSPTGRYVAFIEVVGQAGAARRRLVVLELSGRTLAILGESAIHGVSGVRDYAWCCDAGTLAIVTGVVGEPAGPVHSGIYLKDVRTGAERHIEGVRHPLQLAWAGFDSSIYIQAAPPPDARGVPGGETWPVYRYNAATGRLSLTKRRGIHFSPDGKYYFDTGWAERSGFWLYQASGDQEVTGRFAQSRQHVGPEAVWAPGADHAVVFVEKQPPRPEPKQRQERDRIQVATRGAPRLFPDRWNLVVDAETGQVVDRFQGDIAAGWKTNARFLPVERRTGVELVRLRKP